MTSRSRFSSKRFSKTSKENVGRRGDAKSSSAKRRKHLLETLEARQLMAVGPQLIGIQANDGELILDGTVRNEAPTSLTFRFDENQQIDPTTFSGIRLERAGRDGQFDTADDVTIQPGLVALGDNAPNEVIVRFASALPDDEYRATVFGVDSAALGVTGLRNQNGEFFQPSVQGQSADVVNFELNLGALVESVVPQPVIRDPETGELTQNRNEIVVFFNEDPLFVEDSSASGDFGTDDATITVDAILTSPLFDDATVVFTPSDTATAATAVFDEDANEIGVTFASGSSTFDEVAAAIGALDGFNASVTAGDGSVTFTPPADLAEVVGNPTLRSAENPRFYQLLLTQDTVRTTDDTRYEPERVIYDAETFTARLIFADDLNELGVGLDGNAGPGLAGGTFRLRIGTAVDNRVDLILPPQSFDLTATDAGETLSTAFDIGVLSDTGGVISQIFSESISPQPFDIQLPGSDQDPGRREINPLAGNGLVQFVNSLFGDPNSNSAADVVDGITEISYNFQGVFANVGGTSFVNQISEVQRDRIREVLGLWSRSLGVQFRETVSDGITFAVGNPAVLPPVAGTTLQNFPVLNATVRIDPTFGDAALVFNNQANFNLAFGEDFTRQSAAGVGLLLGLEQAPGAPLQTLLALDPQFLNASIDTVRSTATPENVTAFDPFFPNFTNPNPFQVAPEQQEPQFLEPVFPGRLDILQGQFIHRPDSNDIDLFRFEVNLNDDDRVGTLTVETFAERLADSSSLDTTLTLFEETRATATTSLGAGVDVQIEFTSEREGRLGNNTTLQFVSNNINTVSVTQQLDAAGNPVGNGLVVNLPITGATASQVVNAINNSQFSTGLITGTVLSGGSVVVGTGLVPLQPVQLSGGDVQQLRRNDDYFSEDSRIIASLGEGTYYVGVAASGNNTYDPTIAGSGFGGLTQGRYDLSLRFEPQVDEVNVIRDLDSARPGVPGTALDGDLDGIAGGAHNFFFQTRAQNRRVQVTGDGSTFQVGQSVTVTGASGRDQTFQFVENAAQAAPGTVAVLFESGADGSPATSANELATRLQDAINGESIVPLNVTVTADGSVLEFTGEQSIELSLDFNSLQVFGRNIFVDNIAGPNADGTLANPFNNIAGSTVANAFGASLSGDIIRIVGNGGLDGDLATEADNFSFQVGVTAFGGGELEDGRDLEVPQGVTTIFDAGTIVKFRGSRISAGSSNLLEDRSQGVVQVLGTPRLVELSPEGAPITTTLIGDEEGTLTTYNDGSVIFTSIYDQAADAAAAGGPAAQQPAPGDFGGLVFRRDLDLSEGRFDLEDEGIFLRNVNHAQIRFGGSSDTLLDSTQELVNPIQIFDTRPTVSFSEISFSADSAISASPNSFEETSFLSPQFQQGGAFTPDFSRVGPDFNNNLIVNNTVNGLLLRVDTTPELPPQELSISARFDDTSITHFIAENLFITGTPGGSIQDGVQPDLTSTSLEVLPGSGLAPGVYDYRLTFVDAKGFESLASEASAQATLTEASSISLTNLQPVTGNPDYVSRRLYRLDPASGDYFFVANLDATSTDFIDVGTQSEGILDLTRQGIRGRLDASLVVDPGTVVKLRGSRIELGQGAQLIAEGTAARPIVFTSFADDRFGAGGTFDTNGDATNAGGSATPARGDFAGIFASPDSFVSLDFATIAFGGGVSLLEGGQSRGFAPLELRSAEGRITNSRFEFNEDGQDGAGPAGRFGRLAVSPSTIFVQGSQPVIVGNEFLDNRGATVTIDVDSLTDQRLVDLGRQNGDLNRFSTLDDNFGPLVRLNRFQSVPAVNPNNRQVSGLLVRGGELSTGGVFDDTDIPHILLDSIEVGNAFSGGGLRLLSRNDESLVVKLDGPGSPFSPRFGTGITASGQRSSVDDRIGGSVQIVGFPSAPVILTSLADDSVGAGLAIDGTAFTDTNGDGIGSRPEPNDFRGILLDEFSNDRNFDFILENNLLPDSPPGQLGSIGNAQVLGNLAPNVNFGDDQNRLGFEVEGFISTPGDVDTFSFTAEAGTRIFVDVDSTTFTLDSVIEILDNNGQVIARSDDSFAEVAGLQPLQAVSPILQAGAQALDGGTPANNRFGAGGLFEDFGSTNPRDAGLSLSLPGNRGTRNTYFFRIRSASENPNDVGGGITSGGYRFQVRLREEQEFPGSVIRNADIRFANNGIHVRGLNSVSPLLGDIQENESVTLSNSELGFPPFDSSNDSIVSNPLVPGQRAQFAGDLLFSRDQSLSIGGSLASPFDIDFFQIDLLGGLEDNVLGIQDLQTPVVFDIDFADGFSRPDTSILVFHDADGEFGPLAPQLVFFGEDSNVLDDQANAVSSETLDLLTGGSISTGDPLIGPVSLTRGTYYVGVVADGALPIELSPSAANPLVPINPLLRREPIEALVRIFDDRIEASGGNTAAAPVQPNFVDVTTLPAGVSTTTARAGDAGRQQTSTFNRSRIIPPVPTVPNQSLNFDRSVANTLLASVPFDLTGYSAADLPRFYFDYLADLQAGDTATIQIRQNDTGVVTPLSGAGLFNFAPTAAVPNTFLQGNIDLGQFAGQSNLQIEFVYNTAAPNTGPETGLFIDSFILGFAERGELITNATQGAVAVTAGNAGVLAGEYQLEVRPGTSLGTSVFNAALGVDTLNLTQSFDTNERHVEGAVIVAPNADQISDGDTFELSDGFNTVEFEFNLAGSPLPQPGNISVPFTATDTQSEIADAIRNAINLPVVQSIIEIRATDSTGSAIGGNGDTTVALTGTLLGDFNILDSESDLPPSGTPLDPSGGDFLLPVIFSDRVGDSNVTRSQSLVIVEGNRISNVRSSGVFSEPGDRGVDPEDVFTPFVSRAPVGPTTPGAVRNLPELNDEVIGGEAPGIVVRNNTIDQAGFAGIRVDGEIRPFVIDSAFFATFGMLINDGFVITIDAQSTRVVFEFDDISATPVPAGGNGAMFGNGVVDGHVPILFDRLGSRYETFLSIFNAIQGSILVTNGIAPLVDATLGSSLLGVEPGFGTATATPFNQDSVAIYLEGVTNIQFTSLFEDPMAPPPVFPFATGLAPVFDSPQPVARIINNTIFGNDGTASTFPEPADNRPNETIAQAIQTRVGSAHTGAFIDTGTLSGAGDVDLFQVQLGVGDRLVADIDTFLPPGANPADFDTSLRIFNSIGQELAINDFALADNDLNIPEVVDPATGVRGSADTASTVDAFIDFFAPAAGTYFVGVSRPDNVTYDPNSLAGRPALVDGSAFNYTIGIEVFAPRTFVLSIDDLNNATNDNTGSRGSDLVGTSFTITQIPDLAGTTTNQRTFTFTTDTGGQFLAGGVVNIPIPGNNPNTFFVPETAEAIANAITGIPFGTPGTGGIVIASPLPNDGIQNGPGGFDGPIAPVIASALGGPDGDGAGLELFGPAGRLGTGRTNAGSQAGFNPRVSLLGGFGIDRPAGAPTFSRSVPGTGSFGTGTTQLFVFVERAAEINISPAAAAAGLRLDPIDGNNIDQLILETGILLNGGSSGVALNNVLSNLHQGIVVEEIRASGFNGGPNIHPRPANAVATANTFQHIENANTIFRTNANNPFVAGGSVGIIGGPSNINAGADDFGQILGNTAPLFVNADGGNFLPAFDSTIVDSALNAVTQRASLANVLQSVGLPPSNIIAPTRDINGVLRADDPSVSPPPSIGGQVFRDRGSTERADFVGPVAIAIDATDGQSVASQTDPFLSVLQLPDGIIDEFRIQLRDSGDASDPFNGQGVDDDSVVVAPIDGLRASGANIAFFENDQLLVEGIDYSFDYDPNQNVITLTPLAGAFRNDRAYRVLLNNQDRSVVTVPGGDEISDGDQLSILDSLGGELVFEFETGFSVLVPEAITLIVPQTGAGLGGLSDGDTFVINDGTNPPVLFEFNNDALTLPGSTPVALTTEPVPTDPDLLDAYLAGIAASIAAAIQGVVDAENLDVDVRVIGQQVVLGTNRNATADTTNAALSQPARTLGLQVPAPAQVNNGDELVISNGTTTETFELRTNAAPAAAGNTAINIQGLSTASEVATAVLAALGGSDVAPDAFLAQAAGSLIFLNLPVGGSVVSAEGSFSAVGISQTPVDGESILIAPGDGSPAFTLELDSDGVTDTTIATNVAVPFTRSTTADELIAAINNAIEALPAIEGLTPDLVTPVPGGQLAIGGVAGLNVTVNGQSLQVIGEPSVASGTSIEVVGPLVLNVPNSGGALINPGSVVVAVDDAGQQVVFEFQLDTTVGPTNVPGATPILFNSTNTPTEIRDLLINAFNGANLGFTATDSGPGQIALGQIDESRIELTGGTFGGVTTGGLFGATVQRGLVADGETLTITQGPTSVTYEFDLAVGGGGITAGNVRVAFAANSTTQDIAVALAAAINNFSGGLQVDPEVTPDGVVLLNDVPGTIIDTTGAPTLNVSGIAGGATPVQILPSFGPVEVQRALIEAINGVNQPGQPAVTSLAAQERGGSTLFVSGAVSISGPVQSFSLPAIRDLIGNPLEANRNDGTTQFVYLLSEIGLDFGDAPDPVATVPGRLPTLLANDGPRHVTGGTLRLGTAVDSEVDGIPTALADGDDFTLDVSTPAGSLFTVAQVSGVVTIGVDSSIDPLTRDGDTIFIDTGVAQAVLEFDTDGIFDEDNFAISPTDLTSVASITQAIQQAIEDSPVVPASVSSDAVSVTISSDDEDGIQFIGPNGNNLNAGIATIIEVTVTGSGVLEGFIDFNADGDFDDPGEQVIPLDPSDALTELRESLCGDHAEMTSNSFGGGTGVNTREFCIVIPPTAALVSQPTNTFARFRVSATGGLGPTGLALSGEVEDYLVQLLPGLPPTVTTAQQSPVFEATEDTPLSVPAAAGLLVGVTDPQGDTVSISPADVTPPGQPRDLFTIGGTLAGSLNLAADGSFDFTPAADFNGSVQFVANVTDGILIAPQPITTTINVAAVNDAPVRSGDFDIVERTLAEDAVQTFTIAELIAGTTNGTGPLFSPGPANEADQGLIFDSAFGTAGAGLSDNGGTVVVSADGTTITYTPPENFSGSDSFSYRVIDVPTDGTTPAVTLDSQAGIVELTITAVNDAPIARDDNFQGEEDVTLTIPIDGTAAAPGILDNDDGGPTDEDQAVTLVTAAFPITTANGGTVTLDAANNSLIYVPPSLFSGIDTFQYSVADSAGLTSTATVSINLSNVNSNPVFVGLNGQQLPGSTPQNPLPVTTIERTESQSVATTDLFDLNASFIDPEGEALVFTVTSSNPGVASISQDPNSPNLLTVTYPPFGFGTSALTITATDPEGASATQVINVNVLNVPDPPSLLPGASLDPLVALEDESIVRDLRTVFTDPDNDPLTFSVTQIGSLVNPTAAQIAANPLIESIQFVGDELRIELDPDQSGTVEGIQITATDGTFEVTDTFTLSVTSVADAPVATNDSFLLPLGSTLNITDVAGGLLQNDVDADGDSISIVPGSVNLTPAPGLVTSDLTVNADGTLQFQTPSGASVGDEFQFSYQVVDSTGLVSNTATATITINQSTFQNPVGPFVQQGPRTISPDVTADGNVTALDVLVIINFLAAQQAVSGSVGSVPVSQISTAPPNFLDPNGDGVVSVLDALDVLNVIQLLNNQAGPLATQSVTVTPSAPAAATAVTSSIIAPVTSGLPSRQIALVDDDDRQDDAVSTITADDATDRVLSAGFAVESAVVENSSQLLTVSPDSTGTASEVDRALAVLFDDDDEDDSAFGLDF